MAKDSDKGSTWLNIIFPLFPTIITLSQHQRSENYKNTDTWTRKNRESQKPAHAWSVC